MMPKEASSSRGYWSSQRALTVTWVVLVKRHMGREGRRALDGAMIQADAMTELYLCLEHESSTASTVSITHTPLGSASFANNVTSFVLSLIRVLPSPFVCCSSAVGNGCSCVEPHVPVNKAGGALRKKSWKAGTSTVVCKLCMPKMPKSLVRLPTDLALKR